MHCARTLPDRVEAWLTCVDVSHQDIIQARLATSRPLHFLASELQRGRAAAERKESLNPGLPGLLLGLFHVKQVHGDCYG